MRNTRSCRVGCYALCVVCSMVVLCFCATIGPYRGRRLTNRSERVRDILQRGKAVCASQLLAEECILHFIQSVDNPPPVVIKRSKHPYESHSEARECVHIPGASKLLVRCCLACCLTLVSLAHVQITFDPRCEISTDMLTRLCFYRDEEYQVNPCRVSNTMFASSYCLL